VMLLFSGNPPYAAILETLEEKFYEAVAETQAEINAKKQ
jgi:hypothetical protein